MTDIILGAGEVGTALGQIFKCPVYDIGAPDVDDVRIMHVAFPFTDDFMSHVRTYQRQYKPEITVIHSSVVPGTSRALGAVHSPVLGKHPDLAPDIRSYPKWIGADTESEGTRVYRIFRQAGLRARLAKSSVETELWKLLCTSTLGINAAWAQEIDRMCREVGVEYEGWQNFMAEINEGLIARGLGHAARPLLSPGPIGGHCVLPNFALLSKVYPSGMIAAAIDSDERVKEGL